MSVVEKVSWIARLELSKEEKEKYEKEIEEILKAFEKISEVDTSDVEFEVVSKSENSFREDDEPKMFEDVNGILENFPKREGRKLDVPRFL